MNMMNKANLIVVMILFFCTGSAVGQERTLVISSNVGSAHVYVDGEWLGVVTQSPFNIALNAKSVRVAASQEDQWSVDPLLFELPETSVGTVSIDVVFPQTYRVESVPSGARVFNQAGVQLGVTPLQWSTKKPLEEELLVSLGGHEPITFLPGSDVWNRHIFSLKRLSPSDALVPSRVSGDRPPRRWVNKVVLTSAFAAGALAVHFRTKADNRFDDYNQTGNRALRSEIRRLDVQSGVALGAMQLGIGVVAIRLAF